MRITVVDTGTANLASMRVALQRLGAEVILTCEPGEVRAAESLVLPGVGAFATGMARLTECGLGEPIVDHVNAERPFLAVCLGLQLLCRSSEESPGVRGMGALQTDVRRFPDSHAGGRLTVPQLGWNDVTPDPACALLQAGHAYFANSYHLAAIPDGWTGAESVHGLPFVAALERGPMLACQFHPELSGAWGSALLRRWLERHTAC